MSPRPATLAEEIVLMLKSPWFVLKRELTIVVNHDIRGRHHVLPRLHKCAGVGILVQEVDAPLATVIFWASTLAACWKASPMFEGGLPQRVSVRRSRNHCGGGLLEKSWRISKIEHRTKIDRGTRQ